MKPRVQYGFAIVMLVSSAVAGETEYLRAIETEAEKVDVISDQGGESTGEQADTANAQLAFERLLRERYNATFQLFAKLPKTSQREVFANYRSGGAIDAVRRDVIGRLLER